MAQQPALQLIGEKHPSYLRVLPTPVADEAVKNMLFLAHDIFLGSDADMQEGGCVREGAGEVSTRRARNAQCVTSLVPAAVPCPK